VLTPEARATTIKLVLRSAGAVVAMSGVGTSRLPERYRYSSGAVETARRAGTVIIVEGQSDKVALETLARRRGLGLAGAGVEIVAIGGAHAIGRFVFALRLERSEVVLRGLCDEREEPDFRRALERAGLGRDLDRAGLERLGFHVCVADLEDELIRALGVEGVERVIGAQGELPSLRRLQAQPAQRGRSSIQHLRRFISSRAGRKAQYARALVLALDLGRVPRPLDAVLGC
jgi:hypothetical protein